MDKYHRIGPPKENDVQDIIVRFKSHTAKENFFIKRKNIKKKVKIRPSLAPDRKELLEEAVNMVNEYINNNDNGSMCLKNPPHFVYADMHGNLKLKVTHKFNNKLFFRFSSITELCSLIKNSQEFNAESRGNDDE